VPELLTLQRACLLRQARTLGSLKIPGLDEDLTDVARSLEEWTTLVVRADGRLVASARARLEAPSAPEEGNAAATWAIARVMVVPDLHDSGLHRWLVDRLAELAPEQAGAVAVHLGPDADPRPFRRAGFRPAPQAGAGETRLVKRRG
jgi:tRNA (guanine37-N1)-methyltransferase